MATKTVKAANDVARKGLAVVLAALLCMPMTGLEYPAYADEAASDAVAGQDQSAQPQENEALTPPSSSKEESSADHAAGKRRARGRRFRGRCLPGGSARAGRGAGRGRRGGIGRFERPAFDERRSFGRCRTRGRHRPSCRYPAAGHGRAFDGRQRIARLPGACGRGAPRYHDSYRTEDQIGREHRFVDEQGGGGAVRSVPLYRRGRRKPSDAQRK